MSLATALLILGIVDKGMEMRLLQYGVSPELIAIDAAVAVDLAEAGRAVLDAVLEVVAATETEPT